MSPSRRADPPRPAASWAGDSPLPGAARERLLEAATRCIARDGIDGLSMASVAGEAGVSRPTLYRYFADRRTLLEATLFYAGRSLADALGERLRGHASPADKAVEAMLFVHGEIPRDPVLGALWGATQLDAFAVAGITRPTAVAWACHALKDLVQSAGWSHDEAQEAVETMLRMLLSLLTAPEPRRSDADLRAYLLRRLVPALGLAARTPSRPIASHDRAHRR
ncbi:MAG TPA: TetR/AcrR family transcriptional regulator [Myxococcota bacterium]|nr:TetR/AcrR family transcriptional regulator [Myxococcota bacterium]